MDNLKKHKYLEFYPDTFEVVRKDVNLHRPGEMKEAVRILHEWIQQQPHFKKKDFHPVYLESIIVNSKGSVERAKTLMDKMCTIRTLMPKYFEVFNVKKNFNQFKDHMLAVILPKLTKQHYRIVLIKFFGKMGNDKMLESLYKYGYIAVDYTRLYDYNNGVIVLYDLSEIDLHDAWLNVNLNDLKNFYSVILESYGLRLKRIHVITKSKVVDTFFTFIKTFLKKKITERIVLNKSADELLQYYPKEILPKEYGGSERTVNDLQEYCLEEASTEENLKYIRSLSEAKVDESLRPQGQFNELYAGITGTFRALSID